MPFVFSLLVMIPIDSIFCIPADARHPVPMTTWLLMRAVIGKASLTKLQYRPANKKAPLKQGSGKRRLKTSDDDREYWISGGNDR